MIDTHSLKAEVLQLAQYLAPGEQMTALESQSMLRDTVARIAAAPGTTTVQMALIAVELAARIDRETDGPGCRHEEGANGKCKHCHEILVTVGGFTR